MTLPNLARIACTSPGCAVVFRLAPTHVRAARAGLWCPICLQPAQAPPDVALSDETRALIQAAVARAVDELLPAINADAEAARRVLKRRAAKMRKALKQADA